MSDSTAIHAPQIPPEHHPECPCRACETYRGVKDIRRFILGTSGEWGKEGSEGLVVRMDRVEQQHRIIRWLTGTAVAAAITSLVAWATGTH